MYENITVVIPSYKPDEKLISTVRGIKEAGFSDIIVVDDGGAEKYAEYFIRVKDEFGCTVLHHEVNRGKGAALKTAFKYYAENRPSSIGLVTADADGQHLPRDIASVADRMAETGNVIIGSRDFSEPQVPPRSKAGNRITSTVFKIFFGMKIGDTQTGLRGLPREYVSILATADGDRYEYETHMLFLIQQMDIPFEEVKISTVYIDENSSSHFRVFRDSTRIYALLLRFAASSIISTAIDVAAFLVLLSVLSNIGSLFVRFATAALLARLVSSVINYIVNAKAVFRHRINACTLGGYYLITALHAIISAAFTGAVAALTSSLAWATVLKLILDFFLFTTDFQIQHNKVFRDKR